MRKLNVSSRFTTRALGRLAICSFAAILFLTLCGILSPAYGQWPQTMLDDNIGTAQGLSIADIDGDNDPDVIAGAFGANHVVAWYENPSWDKHYIDTNHGTADVIAVDMDGDSDFDVVAGGESVVWYENDGTATNWTLHTIRTRTGGYAFIDVADMDNDTDLDVAAGWFNGRDVEWYENTSSGWVVDTIDLDIGYAGFVSIDDINGDGTPDVTISTFYEDKVYWYEAPAWNQHTIFNGALEYALGLAVADIDADNDADVVASIPYLAWFESDGASPPAWIMHRIDAQRDSSAYMWVGDMEDDNDLDIITTYPWYNEVIWYRNENFAWVPQIIANDLLDPNFVTVDDLDGDGDLDVVANGYSSGDVVIYWNPITGIEPVTGAAPTAYSLYQNYPNPFNPSTTIEFALPKAGFVTLTIYNVAGEKVATLVSENLAAGSYQYQWETRGLASGVYFYKLVTNNGFAQTKKMLLIR